MPTQHGTVVIAVGDELLGGFTLDTNSHWLAGRLREVGYGAVRMEIVADRVEAIVDAVHRALAEPRADRIVVSGGLGPTTDDRTLLAIATALDRPLEEDATALAHVQGLVERMHAAGWVPTTEISAANRRMTVVPRGALVLHNRRGMAPGLGYPIAAADAGPAGGAAPASTAGCDGRWLFVLPGVPRELRALADEEMLPRFFSAATVETVVEQRYRRAVEAEFFEPMRLLEEEFGDVAVGSYPQTETRELVIRLHGLDASRVAAAHRRLIGLRPPDPEDSQETARARRA